MERNNPDFDGNVLTEELRELLNQPKRVSNALVGAPMLTLNVSDKRLAMAASHMPLSLPKNEGDNTTLTARCMKERKPQLNAPFFTNAMEADEFYYPTHLR
tara:strand:- start:3704 stop:4006 length:303 start_codon:yes stop_codon:yes gene_type:complete